MTDASPAEKIARLHRFNLWMVALHAAQAVAIIVLSTDFSLPVEAGFLEMDPATNSLEPATKVLFDLPLAWLVAGFLLMSSSAHLYVATVGRRRYEEGLVQGINRARWYEYALSASTMMVAIAMLVGIYDAVTLIAIFALTATMNMMGLMMEVHNQRTPQTEWLAFKIGTFAGIIPWIGIALYFIWAAAYGDGGPPTFVYVIYVSIFAFFNCFAINMWLQYRGKGRWRDYLYGERMYIILSLTAKSALAWQVFAGTLRP